MDLKTTGVILKQRNLGENDVVITILSKDLGIIEAIAKGIKSAKSKLRGGCQILCLSQFDLFKTKNSYRVISAQVVNSFYNLRLDVEKFALAGYFSEITLQLSQSIETTEDFTSLLLNSIHLLEQNKKPDKLIKSIFELRGISIAGFMPNLICCKECNEYLKDIMYFIPLEGQIVCSDCLSSTEYDTINISTAVLTAMRHIIYSPPKKIYSFGIDDISLNQLNFITQKYLLINAQGKFPSLNVYYDLLGELKYANK